MKPYDASSILGIDGNITPEQTKKAYRDACKKYHPDINPAGEDMMKIINQAYHVLKDFTGNVQEQQTNYSDLLSDALNAIIDKPDLIIEICGSWLWVTGNTKSHKETLKETGFKWASKKKAWYFRPEQFRSKSRGKLTLDEIRTKYGSDQPPYKHPSNRLKGCDL